MFPLFWGVSVFFEAFPFFEKSFKLYFVEAFHIFFEAFPFFLRHFRFFKKVFKLNFILLRRFLFFLRRFRFLKKKLLKLYFVEAFPVFLRRFRFFKKLLKLYFVETFPFFKAFTLLAQAKHCLFSSKILISGVINWTMCGFILLCNSLGTLLCLEIFTVF